MINQRISDRFVLSFFHSPNTPLGKLAIFLTLFGLGMLANSVNAEKPKLIVVISVDQFCQEYVQRFGDNFSEEGGFARFAAQGTSYRHCMHQHAFTLTAPGHAVQMTGTYPNMHGVVANNWFDREAGKTRYCVDDDQVNVVGIPEGKKVSPRILMCETAGDVLRMATSNQSKVIGVAIKDRAAILMTGRNATGAYWLEKNKWVTSTYYREDMPGYLRVLNDGNAIDRFRKQSWDLLLPRDKYHNQGPDTNEWENPPKGMTSGFPHTVSDIGEVTEEIFGDQVLFSPFGSEYTLQAAQEILIGESLGKDNFSDILAINLSSNDYVGHAFGPHSLEVEDITYRTDKQLGDFFRFLDKEVGEGTWTGILTADHGVAPIVEYAIQQKLPAARNPLGKLEETQAKLEIMLREKLGIPANLPPLIEKLEENQIFLKHGHPGLEAGRMEYAQRVLQKYLLDISGIHGARVSSEVASNPSDWLGKQLHLTFHPHRSGDVLFVYSPYVVPGDKGTTHGSPWHYDRHVPLMLMGNGIKKGWVEDREVSPACIASTVCELLGIDYPSANVEQPLREAIAK